MRRPQIIVVLLTIVALATGLTGCQTMTGRTAGETFDDATITSKVKSRLVADRAANMTRVGVDTINRTVYLTGAVDSVDAKARAEQLALQTEGVRGVVNNLQVQRATTTITTSDGRQVVVPDPAASPRGEVRHSVSGRVTAVDRNDGEVTLQVPDGSKVRVRVPPVALGSVREGDQASVDVMIRPQP